MQFLNYRKLSNRACPTGILLAVLIFTACSQPFSLYEQLYGPSRLSISPASAMLMINNSIPIVTSGGVPPYIYQVISGGGSFVGNIFTAPPVPATVQIQVTDDEGTIVEAVYTVNATGVSLGITPSSQTIFTGGTIDFSPIGGTGPFEFNLTTNVSGGSINLTTGLFTAGSASGTDIVTITDTFDGSTAVATITVQPKPLNISPQTITVFVNQVLNFSAIGGDGTYSYVLGLIGSGAPLMTGSTYTAGSSPGTDSVIMTDAYDGRSRTATVTVVNTTTNVNYQALPVTIDDPGILLAGTNFDARFSISNIGSAAGSQPISWTVYASTNTAIGGPDDRIATSGSISGIAAGSTTPVLFSGIWPTAAGSYYLLVEVYAPDDLAPANNRNQSAGTTQIYEPLRISPSVASVYTGQTVDFSVTGGTGSYSYVFTATGSGSPVVGAGAQYTAGAVAGTDILQVTDSAYPAWPPASSTVTVSASPATPPPPTGDVDYYVSIPPAGGIPVVQGDPVSASFRIRNQGTDAGSATVSWWAYISSDKVYNAGDILIDSDVVGGLIAGATSGLITINSGTWSTVGNWYLLIRLQATDEVNTTNNIANSVNVYTVSSIAPTEPDYTVSGISMYSPFATTGSSVEESFTIHNVGSNGVQNATWTAYASTDSVPNPGEEIGTGTIGPLNGGQTLTGISLLGATWPAAGGDYFLIVKASAIDEINTGDYAVSAGKFTISNPPDYTIESVTYPVEAQEGTPVVGSFVIRNIGSGNGKKNVRWETYLSFDTGLSADDLLLGSREIGPLTAGATSLVPASHLSVLNWPPYGRCYILIRLSSADDGNVSNNSHISPVKELYILDVEGPVPGGTANDGSGESMGPIANTQGVGPLNLGQTLVIRGWLDSSGAGGFDTYSFTIGNGVSMVSTYATWPAADDIGELFIWDEFDFEASSANNFIGREPSSGYFSVTGWISPETGYVGFRSYRNAPLGNEYPYSIYIMGRE